MTILITTITLIVLAGLSGWLTVKIGEVKNTLREIDRNLSDIKDYLSCINKTLDISSLYPREYYITKHDGSCVDVNVIYKSQDGKRDCHFTVKRFFPGDDMEFAIREAEELLEHLNEK